MLTRSRIWFLLSGLAGFFLLMHAMQTMRPPLPGIRKRGTRTTEESDSERVILRQNRGKLAHRYLKENPGI